MHEGEQLTMCTLSDFRHTKTVGEVGTFAWSHLTHRYFPILSVHLMPHSGNRNSVAYGLRQHANGLGYSFYSSVAIAVSLHIIGLPRNRLAHRQLVINNGLPRFRHWSKVNIVYCSCIIPL